MRNQLSGVYTINVFVVCGTRGLDEWGEKKTSSAPRLQVLPEHRGQCSNGQDPEVLGKLTPKFSFQLRSECPAYTLFISCNGVLLLRTSTKKKQKMVVLLCRGF